MLFTANVHIYNKLWSGQTFLPFIYIYIYIYICKCVHQTWVLYTYHISPDFQSAPTCLFYAWLVVCVRACERASAWQTCTHITYHIYLDFSNCSAFCLFIPIFLCAKHMHTYHIPHIYWLPKFSALLLFTPTFLFMCGCMCT